MANADAGNRERIRLESLETSINELTKEPPRPAIDASGTITADAPVAQRLENARNELRALELRWKPEHPEIRRAKRVIAELEAKAELEALSAPVAPPPTTAGLPPAIFTRVAQMRQEAEELRNGLESRRVEEERLKRLLTGYATRLEAAPALESELTELMRDYTTLSESYDSLRRKSEESKMALNLERRQIGEQFKIVDGARLPERPFSPNRIQINTMGIAAGFAVGIALLVLLEYRDTTLKTDADVMTSLSLPVLAVIPAMMTAGERKQLQRRRAWLFAGTTAVLLLGAAVVVAWKLELVQGWIG
jgi:uncharacterized protein involved in exopolysaccharide biosynthesis